MHCNMVMSQYIFLICHFLAASSLWGSENYSIKYQKYENILASTSENVLSDMFAQRRFRFACAFAQANLNLHWAHFGQTRMQSFFTRTTKTDQTVWMRRRICVFMERRCHKVCFRMLRLTYPKEYLTAKYIKTYT